MKRLKFYIYIACFFLVTNTHASDSNPSLNLQSQNSCVLISNGILTDDSNYVFNYICSDKINPTAYLTENNQYTYFNIKQAENNLIISIGNLNNIKNNLKIVFTYWLSIFFGYIKIIVNNYKEK